MVFRTRKRKPLFSVEDVDTTTGLFDKLFFENPVKDLDIKVVPTYLLNKGIWVENAEETNRIKLVESPVTDIRRKFAKMMHICIGNVSQNYMCLVRRKILGNYKDIWLNERGLIDISVTPSCDVVFYQLNYPQKVSTSDVVIRAKYRFGNEGAKINVERVMRQVYKLPNSSSEAEFRDVGTTARCTRSIEADPIRDMVTTIVEFLEESFEWKLSLLECQFVVLDGVARFTHAIKAQRFVRVPKRLMSHLPPNSPISPQNRKSSLSSPPKKLTLTLNNDMSMRMLELARPKEECEECHRAGCTACVPAPATSRLSKSQSCKSFVSGRRSTEPSQTLVKTLSASQRYLHRIAPDIQQMLSMRTYSNKAVALPSERNLESTLNERLNVTDGFVLQRTKSILRRREFENEQNALETCPSSKDVTTQDSVISYGDGDFSFGDKNLPPQHSPPTKSLSRSASKKSILPDRPPKLSRGLSFRINELDPAYAKRLRRGLSFQVGTRNHLLRNTSSDGSSNENGKTSLNTPAPLKMKLARSYTRSSLGGSSGKSGNGKKLKLTPKTRRPRNTYDAAFERRRYEILTEGDHDTTDENHKKMQILARVNSRVLKRKHSVASTLSIASKGIRRVPSRVLQIKRLNTLRSINMTRQLPEEYQEIHRLYRNKRKPSSGLFELMHKWCGQKRKSSRALNTADGKTLELFGTPKLGPNQRKSSGLTLDGGQFFEYLSDEDEEPVSAELEDGMIINKFDEEDEENDEPTITDNEVKIIEFNHGNNASEIVSEEEDMMEFKAFNSKKKRINNINNNSENSHGNRVSFKAFPVSLAGSN
eukprot:TRINITY_DN185329_c0_g1_i1.p1 TRINITY_DN185329_c0_g1~~TRINITY_DN185329_c0_g1_i1.p1  ORF type:complete len:820 (+),score=192.73 TRINITY_DN185329_c0_g1_i1:162-2621(+)